MKINYVVVDASEYLKEIIVNHINKECEDSEIETINECKIGHPLEIQGKMLINDLENIDKLEQKDLILYGYCVNFYMSGLFRINLWLAEYFQELVYDSLEENNLCYDNGDDVFGDIIIDCSNEADENLALKWIKYFPTLIENSKEYKELINKLDKWTK